MGPQKSHASAGHIVHLVCPHCSKEFNGNSSTSGVRSNYRRHLLTHTGERPHSCPYCCDSFTTRPNLRRHISVLHGLNVTPQNRPRRDVDDVPLADLALPLLKLPTSTTTSAVLPSPAPSIASSKHDVAASEVGTVESTGLTSTTESQAAFEAGGVSEAVLLQQKQQQRSASTTFICEDCELEVSSRAKLHRHQRYYCPFRDNIFVDPVQDALNRYRAEQPLQEQEKGNDDYGEESGDVNFVNSNVQPMSRSRKQRSSSVRQQRHRCRRETASTLVLTEEERRYLTRVAAQSGLKFAEDAYASISGSDSDQESSRSSAFQSESSSSFSDDDVNNYAIETHTDSNQMSPLQPPGRADRVGSRAVVSPSLTSKLFLSVGHVSSKRTPLRGQRPSPDMKTLPSPRFSFEYKGKALGQLAAVATPADTLEAGNEDEEDYVDPGGDLLHLHFHRRGSGHKRERHILQKRLRAQEGALLELTSSPQHCPQKRLRFDSARDSNVEQHVEVATHTPIRSPTIEQRQQQPSPSSIVVSEHMMSRAEGIFILNWHQAHRSRVSVSSEFVCPYCNDFSVFSNQKRLTQHMRRMHPAVAERNAERSTTTEPGCSNNVDPSAPPSGFF